MAALASSVSPSALAARLAAHRVPAVRRWVLRPYGSSAAGGGGGERRRQLVLYSKPGCCLCDGLKEKLNAALSGGADSSLRYIDLQVRDITENPEWERLYQYEIPVLAKLLPDGTEETLPRLSPRLGVELIQKKIAAAFDG